ncbi:hypothetical protein AJ87_44710 [Rhizobium yanglingense]|nr:hypothetical protein AJ87_44710 [Rhizobium yanglingense]
MRKMTRFRIGTRLGIGFGFLLLLMLALTQYSVTEVNIINNDLSQINDVNSVKQRLPSITAAACTTGLLQSGMLPWSRQLQTGRQRWN